MKIAAFEQLKVALDGKGGGEDTTEPLRECICHPRCVYLAMVHHFFRLQIPRLKPLQLIWVDEWPCTMPHLRLSICFGH